MTVRVSTGRTLVIYDLPLPLLLWSVVRTRVTYMPPSLPETFVPLWRRATKKGEIYDSKNDSIPFSTSVLLMRLSVAQLDNSLVFQQYHSGLVLKVLFAMRLNIFLLYYNDLAFCYNTLLSFYSKHFRWRFWIIIKSNFLFLVLQNVSIYFSNWSYTWKKMFVTFKL